MSVFVKFKQAKSKRCNSRLEMGSIQCMTINKNKSKSNIFIFLTKKWWNPDKIYRFVKREFILNLNGIKMRSRIREKKGRRIEHGNEASQYGCHVDDKRSHC